MKKRHGKESVFFERLSIFGFISFTLCWWVVNSFSTSTAKHITPNHVPHFYPTSTPLLPRPTGLSADSTGSRWRCFTHVATTPYTQIWGLQSLQLKLHSISSLTSCSGSCWFSIFIGSWYVSLARISHSLTTSLALLSLSTPPSPPSSFFLTQQYVASFSSFQHRREIDGIKISKIKNSVKLM